MRTFRFALVMLTPMLIAALLGTGYGALVGDETDVVVALEDGSETEDDAGDGGGDVAGEATGKGAVVREVAKCAPRGRDGALEGADQKNHGAFAKAAAHGESVTFGGETYDLETPEGAAALCASLEASAEGDGEVTGEEAPVKPARGKSGSKGKAKKKH